MSGEKKDGFFIHVDNAIQTVKHVVGIPDERKCWALLFGYVKLFHDPEAEVPENATKIDLICIDRAWQLLREVRDIEYMNRVAEQVVQGKHTRERV